MLNKTATLFTYLSTLRIIFAFYQSLLYIMSKRSFLALTPNICLPATDGPIGSGPCNDAVVAVAENRSEQYQVESSSVFIYQYDALPPIVYQRCCPIRHGKCDRKWRWRSNWSRKTWRPAAGQAKEAFANYCSTNMIPLYFTKPFCFQMQVCVDLTAFHFLTHMNRRDPVYSY